MRKIFTERPQEKVLIYVGWGHVVENPPTSASGTRNEWMAARLKRMTGVDPLTIDQTSVTEAATSDVYAVASARIGNRPAVFFEGANPLLVGRTAGVDLQVVHPRRSYRSGRPAWLVELGGKRISVPRRLQALKGRRLIQAFAADAPADAVPLDQVLVNRPDSRMALIVPPGPVRFAVQQ